jgi:FkbM family methyltransferase
MPDRVRAVARRLLRALRARVMRLAHGPDRLGVIRELGREGMFFGAGRLRRPTLLVRWPSGSYRIATADYDVSRRTFVSGPYGLERLLRACELIERQTSSAVRARDVLEIGANIGTTTVPLISVIGAGHVHAFEPVARNFAMLEENIALNGLGARVTAHQAAVSDHVGSVQLAISERFWGSSRVTDATGGDAVARCVTIDSLIADGTIERSRLALVWIDVEGHEAAVLAGATRLGAVPLVVEYLPELHADLDRFRDLLGARGGRVFDLARGEQVTIDGLKGRTDLLLI